MRVTIERYDEPYGFTARITVLKPLYAALQEYIGLFSLRFSTILYCEPMICREHFQCKEALSYRFEDRVYRLYMSVATLRPHVTILQSALKMSGSFTALYAAVEYVARCFVLL